MQPIKIREIRLRHYRAFTDTRLVLDDITFLVGRNGAGKSTLMDALSFLSEAVTDSLSTALERRGNLEGIRQRQPGKGVRYDVWLAITLEFNDKSRRAMYGLRIGKAPSASSFVVKQEVLRGNDIPSFERDLHTFKSNSPERLQPVIDLESLVFPLIAGSNENWKRIIEVLRGISVHQFSPQAIRSEPKIGSDERLSHDGGNAGDVLKDTKPKDRDWIEERLRAIVPGITGVKATANVGRRVIIFEQEGDGGQTYKFDASMMSDGTIRSLGILLALRQTPRPSLVMLDEIEDSLHPYAHGVLLDAINTASQDFPVVISTHDPEILSHPTATGARIRVVQWNKGVSSIYHLSEQVVANLKPPQTVGRLLRSNALWTDENPTTTGGDVDFFQAQL